jgi:hypothetical protein
MAYYDDKRKAYIDIDNGLKQAMKDGRSIHIPTWIYELTMKHPVGEKALLVRIRSAVQRWQDAVIIDGEEIIPLVEVTA